MSVATFASLDPASYREIVRRALAEDVRWGDITTEVVNRGSVGAWHALRAGGIGRGH
jgi:nicotinate-nucleotide pyrophosphorylase